MSGSLFISYSHLDQAWMQVFRKHLRGMLMDRCKVWTDEDIPPGTTWEDELLGNLKQAGAGLVLASPDYLVSPWCRRELKALHAARNKGRLAGLYWVLLRPCGWQWSELAELQAVQEPATASVEDSPEGLARDDRVLHACGRITGDVLRFAQSENPDLAMVRDLLGRTDDGAALQLVSLLDSGDFAIVCRGLDKNGDDVVIKVLTNTPLHRLRELFLKVSQARQSVRHPSVIKVERVFTVGQGYEQRIVILSELAVGSTLADMIETDAKRPLQERHLEPERIGVILRRVAEALERLHALDTLHGEALGLGPEGYCHVMGPLVPSNVFYDENTDRPVLSLVGVTNFLWHFFDPPTFVRIVNPKSGAYILPEKLEPQDGADQPGMLQRADQYFLGMLALELLEAERIFAKAPAPDPQKHIEDSEARGVPWTRNEQLKELVRRLLEPKPGQRFESMKQVVAQLRALEEPKRVLAKYSFRRYVEPADDGGPAGISFSERFYERFFDIEPAARDVFAHVPDETHHRKLIASLKAVLNYRPGNDPTSINSLIPFHQNKGITAQHFDAFKASFLETLRERIVEDQPSPADAADAAAIIGAWKALFEPVLEEMKHKVLTESAAPPAR